MWVPSDGTGRRDERGVTDILLLDSGERRIYTDNTLTSRHVRIRIRTYTNRGRGSHPSVTLTRHGYLRVRIFLLSHPFGITGYILVLRLLVPYPFISRGYGEQHRNDGISARTGPRRGRDPWPIPSDPMGLSESCRRYAHIRPSIPRCVVTSDKERVFGWRRICKCAKRYRAPVRDPDARHHVGHEANPVTVTVTWT